MHPSKPKQRIGWLVALGLVAASLIYVVVAKVMVTPEPVATPSRAQAVRSRPQTPAPQEPPPAAREPLHAEKPAVQTPTASAPELSGPTCSKSADCRGPKTPDCVLARCEAGHCVFDRSSCECALDGDCDDGVECTRDVCFAATRKCIHMRSGCD